MASGNPRPNPVAGQAPRGGIVLLGFALGGFIDGILLHQVLQWHHLLSAVRGGSIPLATQIAADGLFHLLMYALVLLACWRLWRGRDRLAGSPGRDVLVLALAGFVLWQLVDIVLFHWIAQIHRVRMDTDVPLAWDLGWLVVFGLVPAAIAAALARGRRGAGPGAGHMAASVAVFTLAAGVWAARGPAPSGEMLVLVAPGVRPAQAMAALGDAGGRVTWVSDDGSVWAVRELRRGTAWRLFAQGAVAVGAAPVGLGCASWARVGRPT